MNLFVPQFLWRGRSRLQCQGEPDNCGKNRICGRELAEMKGKWVRKRWWRWCTERWSLRTYLSWRCSIGRLGGGLGQCQCSWYVRVMVRDYSAISSNLSSSSFSSWKIHLGVRGKQSVGSGGRTRSWGKNASRSGGRATGNWVSNLASEIYIRVRIQAN